jgi:hypothetical protein
VQASETPALFKPKQKISMKKIETMTPEQEAQVEIFREQWRKKALSTDRVDQKATKEALTKMYELIGKKPPIFIFCPSLQFAQFQINYCRELFAILKEQGKGGVAPEFGYNLRYNLRENLWDNLGYNLRYNLRYNLGENLGDNLGDNLRENLRDNLRDNLGDNLRYNLGENLRDNLGYNLRYNLRENLWDNLRENLGDNLRYNLGENLGENLGDNLGYNLRENLWDNLGYNLRYNLRYNLGENLGDNLGDNLRENLRDNLRDNLGDNLRENLRDNLGYNLRYNLRENLWDNLGDNLGDNLRYNLGENLGENLGDNLGDNLRDNLRYNLGENLGENLGDNLGDNLRENLGDNLRENLGYNLGDNLRENLWNNLRYNLGYNLQKNLKYEHTDFWGNMDAYWIAFYQFPEKFLGIKYKTSDSEKLELWSKVAESASWFWTYENYCFVSDRPTSYGFDEEYRMHSSTGPAIEFTDGWKLYRWHGVEVPENWILAPETIKKEDVINEQNAEKRRCLMEILGPEKFSEMLGVLVIDQDTDQGGRAIILYRTKNIDPVAEEHIHFARVICPSTEREYFLCVPNTINNIWDAVAWTFKKNKANYLPIIET